MTVADVRGSPSRDGTGRASTAQRKRTGASAVLAVVELLCVASSAPFLDLATYFVGKTFGILGPNDDLTIVYAVVALICAAPGMVLLAVAVALRSRGRVRVLAPPKRSWSPGRRLASLAVSEWAWAGVLLTVATVLWRLYLDSVV